MGLNILSYAKRNVTRRPLRSGALSLAVAAVAGTLFVLSTLNASISASVDRAGARLGADAMAVASNWKAPEGGLLLSGGPTAAYLGPDAVGAIAGFEGVDSHTSQLFIVSASLACCSIANTVLVGYEPETDFTVSPWMRKRLGRGLEPDEIVIGPNILSETGGRIRFFGKVFRVAEKLEPTGIDMMDSAVFIPMQGARAMVAESEEIPLKIRPDDVSAVLIKFAHGVNHAEVALRMELAIPGISVMLAEEAMRAAKGDMLKPLGAMAWVGGIWWLVSMVMTGTLYYIWLEGRSDEVTLMRAMGAKRYTVAGLFVTEVLIMALAGALVGVVLGWLGYEVALGGMLAPDGAELILYAAVSVAGGIVSALAATVYPLLRHSF